MPATFPSHAAAVLPLKLRWPDHFDGVALVIGAAAPDLPYAMGRCQPPYTYGHTWWGVLASVPATMAAARLVRWSAPTVAAHLPAVFDDYGALNNARHPWWVTAGSAFVGAVSHVAWDHVTHARIPGTRVGIPALAREVRPGVPLWMPLHLASSAVGAAGWLAMSAHLRRRRRIAAWHGPAPAVARRRGIFWGTAVAAAAAGVAASVLTPASRERMLPFLPPVPSPAVLSGRILTTVAGALIAATAATKAGKERPAAASDRQPRTPAGPRPVDRSTGRTSHPSRRRSR